MRSTTDRCGSCHNETVGQAPLFVRNDDVNMAYDEAVGYRIYRDQPSLSRFVDKVSTMPLVITAGSLTRVSVARS